MYCQDKILTRGVKSDRCWQLILGFEYTELIRLLQSKHSLSIHSILE
jgi:hypothetical protein